MLVTFGNPLSPSTLCKALDRIEICPLISEVGERLKDGLKCFVNV